MTDLSEELLLKKRARRRLLGALVFASVVAVFLPFLMDENPNQKIDDVLVKIPPPAIDLPEQNKMNAELEEHRPPPLLKEEVAAVPDALLRLQEEQRQAEQRQAENKPKVASVEKVQSVQPKESVVKPEKIAPSRKEILAAQRKAAEEESQRKKEETARVAAILEGRDVANPSTDWVIMIGTFSNANNVKNLREKLKTLNVPSFTETLSNQHIRVRAGPFASQKMAENALTKMKTAGLDGKVIQAQ